MKVDGVERVLAVLNKKAVQYGNNVSAVVGYTAAYAMAVHERREMKWRGLPRDRSVRLGGGQDGRDYFTYGHSTKKGLGVYWGPNGRAGFLLDVAREMAPDLGQIIRDMLAKRQSMSQALLMAGLRLQRESQRNVPVEYGNLKASAFTRLEQAGEDANAATLTF